MHQVVNKGAFVLQSDPGNTYCVPDTVRAIVYSHRPHGSQPYPDTSLWKR